MTRDKLVGTKLKMKKGTKMTYNDFAIYVRGSINMRVASDPKQERINLRLGRDSKQMLERAASFEGKTVSNYILTSALAHAENTIRRHETMVLNRQDSELFLNALTKPAPLNENLLAALEEHSRRVNNK